MFCDVTKLSNIVWQRSFWCLPSKLYSCKIPWSLKASKHCFVASIHQFEFLSFCLAQVGSGQIMGWGEKAIEVRNLQTGMLDSVFMHKRRQVFRFLCERNEKVSIVVMYCIRPHFTIHNACSYLSWSCKTTSSLGALSERLFECVWGPSQPFKHCLLDTGAVFIQQCCKKLLKMFKRILFAKQSCLYRKFQMFDQQCF